MEFIAETCRKHNLTFTSEEFWDLWTTPYSDCVDINCWHAPTLYDMLYFLKSQNYRKTELYEIVGFVRNNFHVDKDYIEKLTKHWRNGTVISLSKQHRVDTEQ